MPKIVDHDERRREIIEVVWRLVATRGIEAMSMRTIAEEAGYANGVLSYYFANKDDVIRQAYDYVYTATNNRIAGLIGDARGLAALRIFCGEVMPRTPEALLEARIATTLWDRAMYDPVINRTNVEAMQTWRDEIAGFLDDAVADGEIQPTDTVLAADSLLTSMMGMQIMAVLTPDLLPSARQDELLENFLAGLHTPPAPSR
ncbi:TetR/AcrR family transcriptional regulator [Gordonia sp. NPDC003424]